MTIFWRACYNIHNNNFAPIRARKVKVEIGSIKQTRFEFNDLKEFEARLEEFKAECAPGEKRVFRIHTEDLRAETFSEVGKAIEMYFTIPEESTIRFCSGLQDVPDGVHVFGGVACIDDITSDDSCVFSKEFGFSEKSILIIFYGGEDFYVGSINATVWKPLERKFIVTKSNGSVLQEPDGVPAYLVYKRYLNIKNDENFFYNTPEFPLFYEHNDTTILRTPAAFNADDSITMSSDIDVGSVVRLCYGDPVTIVDSIKQDSLKIAEFQPDVIHIFSCAARRAFWSTQEPTFEIYPFKNIAPSVGFFSHGEFIRYKNNLNRHNVTLVIAAMREGEKKASEIKTVTVDETPESRVPLVSRLAIFISVTAPELEETNKKLESMNDQLKTAAIVDGLTGLYNRKEIQSRIENSLKYIKTRSLSLVMLDIDNFKQVNDTFGHQEGGNVIIALANILNNKQSAFSGACSVEQTLLNITKQPRKLIKNLIIANNPV